MLRMHVIISIRNNVKCCILTINLIITIIWYKLALIINIIKRKCFEIKWIIVKLW